MTETTNKIGNFIPIKDLFGKSFLVKDYQRGYKWEYDQIKYLLQDIDYHQTKEAYCLQPVIVKNENDVFELIDGQQRITTIYLLWYFLTKTKAYNIEYSTREATKEFLESTKDLNHLHNYIEKEHKEWGFVEWENFVEEYPHLDNVDLFHVFKVYDYINQWYSDKKELLEEGYIEFENEFKNKLKNQVHVIWYDIAVSHQTNSTAEEVFLNLNAGKVPLTDSELIKALFILDILKNNTPDIGRIKAFQLASDWNSIENKLHDDNFWYFICNQKYYDKIDTRIDFLLDLVNNNLSGGRSTYYEYEEQFRTNQSLDWILIMQTFNKLLEWYESDNKKLFHYIGFLINAGICSMADIISYSQNVNKLQFQENLMNRIREEFKRTKKQEDKGTFKVYDREILNYEGFYNECKNVLLLFSINQYINDASNHKFPFDLYNNEKWSVEHINPQNPRDFNTISSLLYYLTANEKYYKNNRDSTSRKELYNRLNSLVKEINSIKDKEQPLSKLSKIQRKELSEIQESLTNDLNLHGIQNLTLLDRSTNSKLSNKSFLDKRKEILDIYFKRDDEENTEVFIPLTTVDVFRKSFTLNEETYKDEIFGNADMDDYEDYLFNKLKPYLEEDE